MRALWSDGERYWTLDELREWASDRYGYADESALRAATEYLGLDAVTRCGLCERELPPDNDLGICGTCEATARAHARLEQARIDYVRDCREDPLLDRRMR